MAEREASLIIRLKDFASKEIKSLQGALSALRSQFLFITGAVGAVVGVVISSIKAYAESEQAVNKLNTALKNQGLFTNAVSDDLQKFATQLSRQTVFTDEAIVESQALLATFGLTADQIKHVTEMAANLSATLGIDLHTSTMILGKAVQGQEGALSRYGLTLSDVENMMGAAASQMDTVSGRTQNLTNRIGELKERIGAELLPVFEFWARVADKVVSAMERISGATDENLQGRELTIDALKREKKQLEQNLASVELHAMSGKTANQEFYRDKINRIDEAIAREQKALDQEEEIENKRAAMGAARKQRLTTEQQQELEKTLIHHEAMIAENMTFEEKRDELLTIFDEAESLMLAQRLSGKEVSEATSNIKRLQKYGEYGKAKQAQDALINTAEAKAAEDLEKFRKKQNEERMKNLESTLQFISTLSTAKNKELAAIGKASAVALATIETYKAANIALGSAPPPYNFALAALVTAAGLVNVAKISGVELASGGIVTPTRGGRLATIGEGGSREAVIPLDDPSAQEELQGVLGGPTIVIQAGVIVADDMSIQEFARRIDDQLFHLRASRQSVSQG